MRLLCLLVLIMLSGRVLSRYDFDGLSGDRWELPHRLDEISGLAVDSLGRVFAHGDERALIYELDPSTQRIVRQFSFGSPAVPGDFEAIAIVQDLVVLATSDGLLYVGRQGKDGESVPFVIYSTGVGQHCEVEGLAYDPGDKSLLLACKTPRDNFTKGHVTIYRWPLQQKQPVASVTIHIPFARLAQFTDLSDLHPSGLTRDSATGHLLLVAAREHAIVELTPTGEVRGVVRLHHKRHPQAEGIAIMPDGTLLISDEAGKDRATVSEYPRVR